MSLGVLLLLIVPSISTMLQSPTAAAADVNVTSAALNRSTATNMSTNTTADDAWQGSPYTDWQVALIVIACGMLVIGTIIGNVLVVTAVLVVRRLQTPSNLLIVSLAISDLLVALLDMPFAAMYEVQLS